MNAGADGSVQMQANGSFLYRSLHERGVALIIGLVILAVLSMIGVAAFTMSTQEERMAGNSRDRIRAFEAAEAALRDCEHFVSLNTVPAAPKFDRTDGSYLAAQPPALTQAEILTANNWSVSANNTVRTASATNSEWSQSPVCIAEQMQVQRGIHQQGDPIVFTKVDHLTSRGYGLNPNTFVMLESYYAE
jgi:type IV pilus assembly protein PilX